MPRSIFCCLGFLWPATASLGMILFQLFSLVKQNSVCMLLQGVQLVLIKAWVFLVYPHSLLFTGQHALFGSEVVAPPH
jgi:hypothetical protein